MSAPTAHSRFGGSVLHRILACPGSVRLSAGIPNRGSEYAAEGTMLHEVAALALEAWLNNDSANDALARLINGLTADQRDVVADYTNAVRTECDILGLSDEPTLLVEQRFSMPGLHAEFFGTADAVIYNRDSLRVIDLKCGRGVSVAADYGGWLNPQLGFYALGVLSSLGWNVSANGIVPVEGARAGTISDIEIMIVQPRAGSVKRRKVLIEELEELARAAVGAVRLADTADAPLAAGDHCRFCPAKAICPALRQKVNDAACVEFAAASMTGDELSAALRDADVIETWLRTIRERARDEISAGRAVPGWKLVRRQGNRKWRDERHAMTELLKAGLAVEDVVEESLRSPSQIERLLKPLKRAALLTDLVERAERTAALAPDTDPRPPAKQSLAEVFTQEGD